MKDFWGDIMDKLLKCAKEYEKFFYKDYYYTLENGLVIKVYFAKKHFHHLIGLGKLEDIKPLILSKNNSATTVYKNILKGKITYGQIRKSEFFSDIKNRIDNFEHLNSMLFEKVVINFKKSEKIPSKLKSDIIFYQDKEKYYLHLCLAKDAICYYPETFIVQHDNYYIADQSILNIVDVKVISTLKKEKIFHDKYLDEAK